MGLLDKLKRLIREPEPFDPSGFDDPIASKTEWTPAKRMGFRLRSHRLLLIRDQRLEFDATGRVLLVEALYVFLGAFLAFISVFPEAFSSRFRLDDQIYDPVRLIVIALGLTISIAVSLEIIDLVRPIVFDKSVGYYWKGKQPRPPMPIGDKKNIIPLHQIHAIQIINELCLTRWPYHSYELNLVLKDGTRLNVVDHGNRDRLRDQARRVASFLDVKVWDASDKVAAYKQQKRP